MQGGEWARFFSTTRGCGAANPPLPAAKRAHGAENLLLAALVSIGKQARSGGGRTLQSELTAQNLTLAEGQRLAGLAPSVKHSVHCRQHSSVIRSGSSCRLNFGPHRQTCTPGPLVEAVGLQHGRRPLCGCPGLGGLLVPICILRCDVVWGAARQQRVRRGQRTVQPAPPRCLAPRVATDRQQGPLSPGHVHACVT